MIDNEKIIAFGKALGEDWARYKDRACDFVYDKGEMEKVCAATCEADAFQVFDEYLKVLAFDWLDENSDYYFVDDKTGSDLSTLALLCSADYGLLEAIIDLAIEMSKVDA